jgi:hypothetical protein
MEKYVVNKNIGRLHWRVLKMLDQMPLKMFGETMELEYVEYMLLWIVTGKLLE